MRDPRFIAEHRGGLLSRKSQMSLAQWGADCAEHVAHLLDQAGTRDERPGQAIQAAREWASGRIRAGEARKAAIAAHAAARECPDKAARSAARSAAHAAATAHMGDHALGAAAYARLAVRLACDAPARSKAHTDERSWQIACLPDEIRELVLSVIDRYEFKV